MASFTVEAFSLDRLRILDYKEIEARFKEFKRLTHFEDIGHDGKSSGSRRSVRSVYGGSGARWILMLVGLCMLSGCANEENVRKSKGFYQEGIARLNSDQQQAYVSFQKAVKLNPDNKEAYYGLGHIYSSQGRFKLAEEAFREAIRIDGDYAEAHTYLGQVLANQDRWKEAIAAYRQALVIHCIPPRIWHGFTWAKPSCMRAICRERWRP